MKTALGRGLESLIPSPEAGALSRGDEIEVGKIRPNEHQPRKIFKDEALKELSASIKEKGVLQPVIVSRVGDGTFRLIAGERRWRAATLAGLKKIPALIKDVSPQDAIEIALIENIQREELNPIETADAFQSLLKEFQMTQEDLSQRVGKDRATISNYLRILKLPEEIKAFINNSSISMGHAKALLALEGKQKQITVAKDVVKRGLSVRETEALCKKLSSPAPLKKKKVKMPEVADLEDKLIKSLGTKVRLHHKNKGGKIEIEYYSLEQLDGLLEILLKN